MKTIKEKTNMPEIILATEDALDYEEFFIKTYVKASLPSRKREKRLLVVIGDWAFFDGQPIRTLDATPQNIQELMKYKHPSALWKGDTFLLLVYGEVTNRSISPKKYPPNTFVLPTTDFLQISGKSAAMSRGLAFLKPSPPEEVSLKNYAFLPTADGALVRIRDPGTDYLLHFNATNGTVRDIYSRVTRKKGYYFTHPNLGTVEEIENGIFSFKNKHKTEPLYLGGSHFARVYDQKEGLYRPMFHYDVPMLTGEREYSPKFEFPPGKWEVTEDKLKFGKNRVLLEHFYLLPGFRGEARVSSTRNYFKVRYGSSEIYWSRGVIPRWGPAAAIAEKILIDAKERGERIKLKLYINKVKV